MLFLLGFFAEGEAENHLEQISVDFELQRSALEGAQALRNGEPKAAALRCAGMVAANKPL